MKKKIAEKSQLIVKHNSLIEARYKLTLQEQKLVLNVARMIKPDDVDFHDYHISVKEFLNLMEVEGKNHAQIKSCAESLLKKPLTIKQEDGFLVCNWFSSVKYIDNAGLVRLRFDPDLKPYMLQLKDRFTAYKIENIMTMTSVFALRLYELLKQYLSIGRRRFELDDLKLKLGVENKYRTYDHFHQKVIVIAKREINAKSDIQIEYEPIKTGRKVTAIEFTIAQNPNKTQPALSTPEEQKLLDQLPVQPNPTIKRAVRKAIKTHGVEGVQEIVTNVTTRNSNGKVEKVGAYLTACLNNSYGVKTREERDIEQTRQKKIKELEEQAKRLRLEAEADEKRGKAEADRCQQIDQAIARLTTEQLNELRGEAEQRILNQNNGQKPMGMGMYVIFKMREIFLEWYEVPE